MDKIQQRFKQKEIKYTLQDGVFSFNMVIGDVVGKLAVVIDVQDNFYLTYAILSNKVTAERQNAVSEYLHRANHGLLYGNFEMDYADGEIRYKLITDCDEPNYVSNKVIDRSVYIPCMMFERYGKGLIKLMLGFGNPQELIVEAETPKA